MLNLKSSNWGRRDSSSSQSNIPSQYSQNFELVSYLLNYVWYPWQRVTKKSLNIPKGYSEAVNQMNLKVIFNNDIDMELFNNNLLPDKQLNGFKYFVTLYI